jgi:hypothetical protein
MARYGEHGYEMINVTYADGGNTLVATKVTGDVDVPEGEVTFTVDLAPPPFSSSTGNVGAADRGLDPIELDADARRRWGRRYLPRHRGRGRVAASASASASASKTTKSPDLRWMEGQMIIVGDFFSFAWVPVGRQIFFGRPSAELTIRMMREAEEGRRRRWNRGDDDDEVGAMRDAAMGMLEETYWVERESGDVGACGDRFGGEGCFE